MDATSSCHSFAKLLQQQIVNKDVKPGLSGDLLAILRKFWKIVGNRVTYLRTDL